MGVDPLATGRLKGAEQPIGLSSRLLNFGHDDMSFHAISATPRQRALGSDRSALQRWEHDGEAAPRPTGLACAVSRPLSCSPGRDHLQSETPLVRSGANPSGNPSPSSATQSSYSPGLPGVNVTLIVPAPCFFGIGDESCVTVRGEDLRG